MFNDEHFQMFRIMVDYEQITKIKSPWNDDVYLIEGEGLTNNGIKIVNRSGKEKSWYINGASGLYRKQEVE